MPKLNRFKQKLRGFLLSRDNAKRLRRALQNIANSGSTPIFFIFTPDIVHFAPYCIPQDADGFEPVLVLNSVSVEDRKWIEEIHPGRLIISLRTSLSGNSASLLSHADVINALFATNERPFCIQDPDCFVIDAGFWKQVKIDPSNEMAAGPFTKSTTRYDHVLPDTFFLILNPYVFDEICSRYGISAGSETELIPIAQEAIQKLGYGKSEYPEDFKGYFDTLQAFWVLALSEGKDFKRLPGSGKMVFHIGGTSYLHKSGYDLSHWDYWPLSVIYFNLRLLEMPQGERFRPRFQALIEGYGSSDQLLLEYPEFLNTWRYKEMQTIVKCLSGE